MTFVLSSLCSVRRAPSGVSSKIMLGLLAWTLMMVNGAPQVVAAQSGPMLAAAMAPPIPPAEAPVARGTKAAPFLIAVGAGVMSAGLMHMLILSGESSCGYSKRSARVVDSLTMGAGFTLVLSGSLKARDLLPGELMQPRYGAGLPFAFLGSLGLGFGLLTLPSFVGCVGTS